MPAKTQTVPKLFHGPVGPRDDRFEFPKTRKEKARCWGDPQNLRHNRNILLNYPEGFCKEPDRTIRPLPDSLPSDQMMMHGGFLSLSTIRRCRPWKASFQKGSASLFPRPQGPLPESGKRRRMRGAAPHRSVGPQGSPNRAGFEQTMD